MRLLLTVLAGMVPIHGAFFATWVGDHKSQPPRPGPPILRQGEHDNSPNQDPRRLVFVRGVEERKTNRRNDPAFETRKTTNPSARRLPQQVAVRAGANPQYVSSRPSPQ